MSKGKLYLKKRERTGDSLSALFLFLSMPSWSALCGEGGRSRVDWIPCLTASRRQGTSDPKEKCGETERERRKLVPNRIN